MIGLPAGVQVHLDCGVADLREGFDELAMLVQQVLRQAPYSGHVFISRGRRGDWPLRARFAGSIATEIKALYWVARGKLAAQRHSLRQEQARPQLDALKLWLDGTRGQLSGKSELQAMRYALVRWAALTRFPDDGRLEIDNNIAERAMRAVALGRKNWLFAGSDRGGEHAAAIYSLIETCKLNGVDPLA